MRILSSYKDYYDYLTGIYGVDDKIVLDRRSHRQPFLDFTPEYPEVFTVYVADVAYVGIRWEDKFLYGEEIIEKFGPVGRWDKDKVYVETSKGSRSPVRVTPFVTKINTKFNCPIIYDKGYNLRERVDYPYPILKSLNFNKILPPQEIYLTLTNWLSPKDKESEPLSDKDKIITNGFDLKTSFRNVK